MCPGPLFECPMATEGTKRRARELRMAGLSVAQIAEEMGLRSHSMIWRWVADLPVPEWTRRPRAKDELRARARELRAQGANYAEIASILGVSKSSVSLWVRDLPILREHRKARRPAWLAYDVLLLHGGRELPKSERHLSRRLPKRPVVFLVVSC